MHDTRMREATLKDIESVAALLERSRTEEIGPELAKILVDIYKKFYNDATVTSYDDILGRPDIYMRPDGTLSVRFKIWNKATRTFTGARVDIDSLASTIPEGNTDMDPGQLRWDAVNAIRSHMSYNCNEVIDL